MIINNFNSIFFLLYLIFVLNTSLKYKTISLEIIITVYDIGMVLFPTKFYECSLLGTNHLHAQFLFVIILNTFKLKLTC
jgi:hypothetical protein